MTASQDVPGTVPESPSKRARPSPRLAAAPDPMFDAPWDSSNWDLNTQQPHGGQEWSSIKNFSEDFSVTTNFMGPPCTALAAATATLQHLHHYPAANFEPALTDLADFLSPRNAKEIKKRLLLGNGASELIDLVTRVGAHQGPFFVKDEQYKEYQRAALAAGREQKPTGDCSLVAIVNPCNPTGEYRNREQMQKYLEELCTDHTTVLVDESMQLWVGPNWRDDSLLADFDWVTRMLKDRDIRVYIIHSWTKIWSCPGLRIGSVVAPTEQDIVTLKEHQVPWSLNVCALGFLSAAVKDLDYLEQTWELTPRWHRQTVNKLKEMFPKWESHGHDCLSWIWVNTKDSNLAQEVVKAAKAAGTPLRWGGLGYNKPDFFRCAVRSPYKQEILFKALEPLAQKVK